MYSREEKSRTKHEFWTAYGQYMKVVPVYDEEGKPKNWLNYKSGVKNIRFKTDVDQKTAYIGIELWHKDRHERHLVFEQFLAMKSVLKELLGEDWIWDAHVTDEHGNVSARIYQMKQNVSVFKKEDWPEIISFFKPRMLALDAFWENAKDIFEV